MESSVANFIISHPSESLNVTEPDTTASFKIDLLGAAFSAGRATNELEHRLAMNRYHDLWDKLLSTLQPPPPPTRSLAAALNAHPDHPTEG